MDEKILRKLRRQLRLLNILLSIFGIIGITGLVIVGILLFKLLIFTQQATSKLNSIQHQANQSLDIKHQLCSSSELSSLLKSQTQLCR